MVLVSTGPDWATIMTAFGTVGAVVAAVGIATWSEWRTTRRLADEHARTDRQLAEERALSAAHIEEERRLAGQREQVAEAYAVQVITATLRGEQPDRRENPWIDIGDRPEAPAVLVINRGHYAIAGVAARFRYESDGHVAEPRSAGRFPSESAIPARLTEGLFGLGAAPGGILTPWDDGVRFVGDFGSPGYGLPALHPIVRWTDRWGTRWEYSLGEVRQIDGHSPWTS